MSAPANPPFLIYPVQGGFAPVLPFTYYANYVYGRACIRAINYDTSTKAWSVTSGADSLVSIASDSDETALLINGFFSMFLLNDGTVNIGSVTKNFSVRHNVPRLDFMRQSDSVPRKFASLTQLGDLTVFDVDENTAPTGSDRMYLFGNASASLGFDGLLAPGISEISLIVRDGFDDDASPYYQEALQDQDGQMLAKTG